MRVINISASAGVKPAQPIVCKTFDKQQEYYAFCHGSYDGIEVVIPLVNRDFPVVRTKEIPSPNTNYNLVDLKRKDKHNNGLFLLNQGYFDNNFIVLLKINNEIFNFEGKCQLLACGYKRTTISKIKCPVLAVTGPCRLLWDSNSGLYDGLSKWVAEFDGDNKWFILPEEKCFVESMIFEY